MMSDDPARPDNADAGSWQGDGGSAGTVEAAAGVATVEAAATVLEAASVP
jgi:hypothetical protein